MVTAGPAPGGQDRFPETRISAVLGLGSDDAIVRDRSYELILTIYWKPVYKYLRTRWKASNEDAQDLTQGFFTRALEREVLEAYDPAKAAFRTYLRLCLDAHVVNERKAARRLKRGGGSRQVSLDFELAERELQFGGATAAQSLEEYFHAEWVRSLFSLAVDDLRRDYRSRGRADRLSVFERYDLSAEDPRPTYEELGRAAGLSAATVTNYLAAARRDFRRCVLGRLRELTASEREYRSEARAILGIEV
jgi:RNA polymerase sigma factor (sigma-70 family)